MSGLSLQSAGFKLWGLELMRVLFFAYDTACVKVGVPGSGVEFWSLRFTICCWQGSEIRSNGLAFIIEGLRLRV